MPVPCKVKIFSVFNVTMVQFHIRSTKVNDFYCIFLGTNCLIPKMFRQLQGYYASFFKMASKFA